jgi:rubredoxin
MVEPRSTVDELAPRLRADTRLECRICWYVYDPAEGDEIAQVPPGTPFAGLPAHWRCPQCDAGREMFLPLDE